MKREIEERRVVPDSQAGFRKRRGAIMNVYVLNHLTRNELKNKRRRMYDVCTVRRLQGGV
jgi:hypothetical protein